MSLNHIEEVKSAKRLVSKVVKAGIYQFEFRDTKGEIELVEWSSPPTSTQQWLTINGPGRFVVTGSCPADVRVEVFVPNFTFDRGGELQFRAGSALLELQGPRTPENPPRGFEYFRYPDDIHQEHPTALANAMKALPQAQPECQHEWVQVGFIQDRQACRKCDKDRV